MQELVFALRQAFRRPALSLAAIVTLSLGLAASIAVFTLVNAVLLRPLPYPEPDRLMAIGRGPTAVDQSGSHRDVRYLREHVRSCAPIASAVSGSGLNVAIDGLVSHQQDRLVSRGYFDALGVQPSWGRIFTVEEDADPPPPVAILNERFLRRHSLDEIQLGGRAFTVVGAVAPAYYGELASFSLDPSVAGVAAALCVVMGLGISLPPLAECLRLNLRDTLHEEGRSGTMSRRNVWMRQALIGAETAACAVLLVGAAAPAADVPQPNERPGRLRSQRRRHGPHVRAGTAI